MNGNGAYFSRARAIFEETSPEMHYRETTSLPCNVALLEFENFENNLYFFVVKYGRTVKKKVWSKAENGERD